MIHITTQMLESVASNGKKLADRPDYLNGDISKFPNLSITTVTPESPQEVKRLKDALALMPSDVGRGTGSFYNSQGNPYPDNWLAVIWSIASLNWSCGKDIARDWSKESPRYTEDGFEKAWKSYNMVHQNPITIGSLYKRLTELKHEQANASSAPPQSKKFHLLSAAQLAAIPPSEWVVKGVIPEQGIAALFGPSGSGKSFLVFDLMMAITHQAKWFGFKIKNKPVVYIGLEGKSGFRNRIAAWEKENNLPSPTNLKIVIDNFNLKTESEVIALASEIVASGMGKGVVVIDTLNQASPGSDENSSVDMGINISRLQLLQELTGGLVLIIHHTGKNAAQGLRGHSSLKAALDANIEVTGGDKKSWVIEKVKDGQDGISRGFKLKVVELGKDFDGDPITSCVVEPDYSLIFTKPEPTGNAQKAALKAIKEKLKMTPKMTIDESIEAIKPTLTTVKANQRNNRAKTIVQGLINGGHLQSAIENDEGVIWMD
jgi:ABC-type dipeptide/oligopeptide/nickel transport system ATPase component